MEAVREAVLWFILKLRCRPKIQDTRPDKRQEKARDKDMTMIKTETRQDRDKARQDKTIVRTKGSIQHVVHLPS
jgi:hypothetical protein